ncbi:GroES-like protein [Cryphonectria parasitica EP155]|uniref:GroES-like protein n=1 Tax=Cryphonectria parasitica (strain ATCC 38755 / EP155) TaxID=660469 RepID=A0A9P4XVS4_CRYP1|nr:GroES-like protein [Cryphonectria parasitica EP155]KAF3761908.1 GroES-like protein [Cryphonectria parasitica EP155]
MTVTKPQVMRAVDIKGGSGPASALFINDATPVPEVQSGECLVKVKAFGINRGDILQRDGKYPGISHLTKIMGLEFSGVIAWINEDQTGSTKYGASEETWKVGDEVFGLLVGGGYAEYVNVNTRMLVRKPKELSFEQTGGLCETWFTALQALYFVGGYKSGSTRSILWHAGASAVSVAGIQLSRDAHLPAGKLPSESESMHAAPKVFATARKQEKCDFVVNELGATGAVDLSEHPDKRSWAAKVRELNGGRGVDLVIDFLGGPYLEANLDVLDIDGRIVQLGWLDGPIAPQGVNIASILAKRAGVQGSQLRSRALEYQIGLRDFFVGQVLGGLVEGRFKHVVERVVPWDRVQEAHELLESNATKGKVVCVID